MRTSHYYRIISSPNFRVNTKKFVDVSRKTLTLFLVFFFFFVFFLFFFFFVFCFIY